MTDVSPQVALVRPRFVRGEDSDALPLDDAVLKLVESGSKGVVRISGPPGSGKTTALRHLAAVLPSGAGVRCFDCPAPYLMATKEAGLLVRQVLEQAAHSLVLFAYRHESHPRLIATFELARWGTDEAIEYLLAAHRDKCSSVMKRVTVAPDLGLMQGLPALWSVVLEGMARDESITTAAEAIHACLGVHFADAVLKEKAEEAALLGLLGLPDTGPDETLRDRLDIVAPESAATPLPASPEARLTACLRQLTENGVKEDATRLLRLSGPQVLLSAEKILRDIGTKAGCACLEKQLPRDLVERLGKAASTASQVLQHLDELVQGENRSLHPMAASILHAANINWGPVPGRPPNLAGAYLQKADWPGIDLSGGNLAGSDFRGAKLERAILNRATLYEANLRKAELLETSLSKANLRQANLVNADLSRSYGDDVIFIGADLTDACIKNAALKSSTFEDAILRNAVLRGANLTGSRFLKTDIQDADFAKAVLDRAVFSSMKLREANFGGASFVGAELTGCNLERVDLPGANFRDARLLDCDLTGASMPDADFRNAKLAGSGLADINWERADLRGADLRGVTFHMGSSRNGLVFSPIASEGSRTGFYTDDSQEQHFKAPEEIRKANLRGADLRGANIEGVDFYLVDLRDALYDAEQEQVFRGSGAILESKVT